MLPPTSTRRPRPTTRCNSLGSSLRECHLKEAAGSFRQPLFLRLGVAASHGRYPMRALILIAVSALAVSACGKSGSVDNTANIDQVLAAQNISANDTTAIDAATGDDANMAADMNLD